MTQIIKDGREWKEERTCPVCGKSFWVDRETKKKKYCGPVCRNAVIRLQQIEYRRRKREFAQTQPINPQKPVAITQKPQTRSLIRLWTDAWRSGTTALQYGAWVAENANTRPVVTLPDWAERGSKDGQNP